MLKLSLYTAIPSIIINITCQLVCFLTVSGLSEAALSKNKPPNILYIMSDDHAAHAIGAYQGRLSKYNPTPNLDQLAREGTLFTNTYVTNSICTPSRASILTGQYSQTNGVLDLSGTLDGKNQHLARAMSGAGYETAMIGKWHLGKEPSAFDYYKVLKSQGTYFDPEFRVQGPKPWPANTVTYRGHSSDIIANQGIQWLEQRSKLNRHKNQNHNKQPFFMMLQFKAPHDMFEYAPRYETYLQNVDIVEPVDLHTQSGTFGSAGTRGDKNTLQHQIGTSVSKRNVRRNMGQHMLVDPTLKDKAYTKLAYQRYLKAYLRCVKGVDDNIGRVIAYLKAQGLYDNTVIVYSSDQGMMLGEHDLIDKRWIYEESMRMPLIVNHPHYQHAPAKLDTLINNTDYAPTLLDIAGVETPKYMQGASFFNAIKNKPLNNWRTATYYRYWMHRAHHDVPAHLGLRTKKYKLVLFYGAHYLTNIPTYTDHSLVKRYALKPQMLKRVQKSLLAYPPTSTKTPIAWEFYDLEKDPYEQNNVYHKPKYKKVIAGLKKEIQAQRKRYNETDNKYPHLDKIINANWNL